MIAYLTFAGFRELTVMPANDVDAVEATAPGWLDKHLIVQSAVIDARLRKRYDVPFTTDLSVKAAPLIVQDWLARVATVKAYWRRGIDADDLQYQDIKQDRDDALGEMKEAADAVDGLYDLPLIADTDPTAITKGAPLAITEASPYVWTDQQRETGRQEDQSGAGTTHGF